MRDVNRIPFAQLLIAEILLIRTLTLWTIPHCLLLLESFAFVSPCMAIGGPCRCRSVAFMHVPNSLLERSCALAPNRGSSPAALDSAQLWSCPCPFLAHSITHSPHHSLTVFLSLSLTFSLTRRLIYPQSLAVSLSVSASAHSMTHRVTHSHSEPLQFCISCE